MPSTIHYRYPHSLRKPNRVASCRSYIFGRKSPLCCHYVGFGRVCPPLMYAFYFWSCFALGTTFALILSRHDCRSGLQNLFFFCLILFFLLFEGALQSAVRCDTDVMSCSVCILPETYMLLLSRLALVVHPDVRRLDI